MCDPSIKRLLITAPPESAKTTWSAAWLGASIGLLPERPRIIASATGAVATRRSVAIRTLIDSPGYDLTFPGVMRARGMGWEGHAWSVAPEGQPYPGRIHPTLSSYGTDGPVTGSRAAEVLGDDLLDERNTRTAYQRELVWRWFQNSLMSRVLARIGRVVIIGTAWHFGDVYAKIKQLDHEWVWCNLPLLSEGAAVTAQVYYPPDHPGLMLGQDLAAEFQGTEVISE